MIEGIVEVEEIRRELELHQRQLGMLIRNVSDIWEVCLFIPKTPFLSTQGDYLTFYTEAHYAISPNERPWMYHFGRPNLGPSHPFPVKISELKNIEKDRARLQVTIGNSAVYGRIEGDNQLVAHTKDFREYGLNHGFLAPLDI